MLGQGQREQLVHPVKSEQYAIVDAIADAIDALNLESEPTIYRRRAPIAHGVDLPACFVTPVNQIDKPATNRSYDVGYGAQVSLVRARDQDIDIVENDGLDLLLFWREEIKDAFRDASSLTGTNVYLIDSEPKAVIDLGAFPKGFDVSGFVFRCWVRHTRT